MKIFIFILIFYFATLSEVVQSSKVAIFGAQSVNKDNLYRALLLGIADKEGEVESEYNVSFQCGTIEDYANFKVNSKTEETIEFEVVIRLKVNFIT
jgi:hypothetical protein